MKLLNDFYVTVIQLNFELEEITSRDDAIYQRRLIEILKNLELSPPRFVSGNERTILCET